MSPVATAPSPVRARPRQPFLFYVGVWATVAMVLTVGVFAFLVDPQPARPTAVVPADGAVLAVPPVEVSVVLSSGQAPREIHIAVSTAAGASVTAGEPTWVGTAFVVPVAIDAAGEYLVGYHALLADGTQVSGLSRFALQTDEPFPAGGPVSEPRVPPIVADEHSHISDDPLNVALVIVAAFLTVAVVVLLVRRPRATVDS